MIRTLICLVVVSSGLVKAQTLKLASDSWPPFTNYDDQVHFASDIVLEALKRSGHSSEVTIIEFGDVITGIKESRYEGSVALWKSDERAEFLIFSKPYLQNRLVLVGKKGSAVDYTSLAELRGRKIAIVENYDYGPELFDLKTLRLVKGKSDQDCLNMLLAGQVDYILLDNLLAHHLEEYQDTDVKKFLAIGDVPLLNKSLHFALNKNIESAEGIIEEFNKTIDEMIKDGTYNDLLNIGWILADIDGDGDQELVLGGDNAGITPPDNIYQIIMSTDNPNTSEASKEYYIQGQVYNDWSSVPEAYKLKPFNNSNNINILSLDLNKK